MEIQKPRRRWFRFRLRTLLVMVTLLSVPLGWVEWEKNQRRKEKEVVEWVEEMGGEVCFPSSIPNYERSWWEKTKENWFGEKVRLVTLNDTPQVCELSILVKLKKLESLSLWGTKVSDLSPLAELNNLQVLYLYDTKVSDLSPLAKLNNLEWLYLRNTQVSDLSPLAELQNLRVLYLDSRQVSDLSPLRELKNLETLAINCTQVSDEQVEELRKALPNCKISF